MLSKFFKRKTTEYTVYAVLGIVIITLGIGIFWTVEDPHVLDVHNAKTSAVIKDGTVFSDIPLRPQEVKPGGIVFMHLDYCKLKSIDGTVVARLVGQKFISRLTWPNDQTKSGCVDAEIPIPIPEKSDDDTYFVEFEVLYQVNPIKTRDVILRSDTFKVMN